MRLHPLATTRRRAVLIGAGALTVVAIGAGATAAVAASPSASPSASASAPAQYPDVRAILRALPESLHGDLKAYRKDTGSAKAAERATIEQKALSGAYGPEAQKVARVFAGRPATATPAIPASLRADLKTLRGDAKGSSARTAEAASIWTKALSGGYGGTIETAAKAALAHRQAHPKG